MVTAPLSRYLRYFFKKTHFYFMSLSFYTHAKKSKPGFSNCSCDIESEKANLIKITLKTTISNVR